MRLDSQRDSSHQHQVPSLLCRRSKNKGNSNKNQKHTPIPPLTKQSSAERGLAFYWGCASLDPSHTHVASLRVFDSRLCFGGWLLKGYRVRYESFLSYGSYVRVSVRLEWGGGACLLKENITGERFHKKYILNHVVTLF